MCDNDVCVPCETIEGGRTGVILVQARRVERTSHQHHWVVGNNEGVNDTARILPHAWEEFGF